MIWVSPAAGRHPLARRRKRPYFKLSERDCHNAGPGRHGDGLGLYLDVRPAGSRAFLHRIVINGVRRDIGLGPFPTVTLDAAREAVLENLRLRRQGGDPLAHRRQKSAPTVEEFLPRVINLRKSTWRGANTEASWLRDFKNHVFPSVGNVPVDRVTIEDVARIVEPHWKGRNSAGCIVRQRLDVLFRHAVVLKYRPDNPAHELLDLLPAVRRDPPHRASVPHAQLRSALEVVRASSAPEVVKDVLAFIVLTSVRLSEATGALWSEIHFDKAMWSIPGPRMKAGYDHDVPLSTQAIEILRRVRVFGNPSVFRFRRRDGNLGRVSGESLNYWIRKLKLRDSDNKQAVVHGFRASFRSWNLQVGGAPGEAAEAALAHRGSPTVRAYLRDGPLFDVRIALMQAWADYVLPRSSR